MNGGLVIEPQPPAAPLTLHPGSGRVLKDEPRTLIWIESLPDGTPAVLKLYRHRRRALGRRVRREYLGLQVLQQAGLATTPPLFWAAGRHPGLGRFELLATRLLPDVRPLREILRAGPEACPDLGPLFRDVARMHAAGLCHGALIPRNVLTGGDAGRFAIMDVPRSARFPRDIRGTRMARFDLLDLCQELLLYGAPDRRAAWLDAYGMPAPARDRLVRASTRYCSTRHLRNRLRFEFQLRALFARFF